VSIIERFQSRVPRVADYFGAWCIREDVAQQLVEQVRGKDLDRHVASMEAFLGQQPDDVGYVENGIGYLDVKGVLMRQQSSLPDASTSTLRLRQKLREFAKDDHVKRVVMLVDSPGGSASGIQEMADEIIRTRGMGKDVYAIVEGQCCSGAYWLASAASMIVASPSSVIGSIGVYTVVEDSSQAAADAGIKVHVVKAGEYKAIGEPGTVVTQEQLDTLKNNLVDPTYQQFTKAVADGRGLSKTQVASLATGEFWHTEAAIKHGLVDAVSDADEFVRQVQEEMAMSEKANEPKAATLSELKAALPNASAEFVLGQLEKSATVQDAAVAWANDLSTKLQIAEAARAEAAAKATAAVKLDAVEGISAGKQQVEADPTTGSYEDDLATFQKAFDAEFAKCKSKTEAYRRVTVANSDLMVRLTEEGTRRRSERLRERTRRVVS
jgi:signal peptide peptidase SppA